ncbi:MAG TPA: ribosome maturation factor RimM [Candidatus Eremiobacteraceae bacterium]|nr:ribosome maturation factor RimM [Candidatus Eremiobacteraceae bacterium]
MTEGELVAIARIIGAFGLRGELKIASGDPDVLQPGLAVCVRRREKPDMLSTITAARQHKGNVLARLAGVDDANAAAALRGAELLTSAARLPELPAQTYREADLVGMHVVDEALGDLGTVQAVRHYPNCDMLVVGAKPVLVPMLHAYRVQVDAKARRISTCLPAGFDELT